MPQQATKEPSKLQVIFDVHQYRLSATEEGLLRDRVDGLARQVEHFPVADLHVLIEGNARSNDVSVKLTLVLPGNPLVTSDHDVAALPAFERALNSLLDSLRGFKERLANVPEWPRGDRPELTAGVVIDRQALDQAARLCDYPAF